MANVTKKYALSANCRREISLSDALKKPIIPVLLEEIQWPPEGPMGMVFSQLLYIRFNRSSNRWSGEELQQLLGKLHYYIPAMTQSTDEQRRSNLMKTDSVVQKPPNDSYNEELDVPQCRRTLKADQSKNMSIMKESQIPVSQNKSSCCNIS